MTSCTYPSWNLWISIASLPAQPFEEVVITLRSLLDSPENTERWFGAHRLINLNLIQVFQTNPPEDCPENRAMKEMYIEIYHLCILLTRGISCIVGWYIYVISCYYVNIINDILVGLCIYSGSGNFRTVELYVMHLVRISFTSRKNFLKVLKVTNLAFSRSLVQSCIRFFTRSVKEE